MWHGVIVREQMAQGKRIAITSAAASLLALVGCSSHISMPPATALPPMSVPSTAMRAWYIDGGEADINVLATDVSAIRPLTFSRLRWNSAEIDEPAADKATNGWFNGDSEGGDPAGGNAGDWRQSFDSLPRGKQSHVAEEGTEQEMQNLFDQWTAGAEQLPARGPKISEVYKLEDGTVIQWRMAQDREGRRLTSFLPVKVD